MLFVGKTVFEIGENCVLFDKTPAVIGEQWMRINETPILIGEYEWWQRSWYSQDARILLPPYRLSHRTNHESHLCSYKTCHFLLECMFHYWRKCLTGSSLLNINRSFKFELKKLFSEIFKDYTVLCLIWMDLYAIFYTILAQIEQENHPSPATYRQLWLLI